MYYNNTRHGIFRKRINRFTAEIEIDGTVEICHVKNTGRCGELFVDGADVIVQHCEGAARKTSYDLIAVYRDGLLFNTDSQSPNKIVYEYIKSGGIFQNSIFVKPECKYGQSRFDFYIETENKKIFAEVKGVNFLKGDTAYFPDAPTERGVKHIYELCSCVEEGYEAYIIFVAQTEAAKCVAPNDNTHKEFGDALRYAALNGVNIAAFNCIVEENFISINKEISVCLQAG